MSVCELYVNCGFGLRDGGVGVLEPQWKHCGCLVIGRWLERCSCDLDLKVASEVVGKEDIEDAG